MPRYFKGKAIGYHTDITVTKTEQIIIWITSLSCLGFMLWTIFNLKSVWMIVLYDFIAFIIMFIIFIIILFNPKHKEERKKNTIITK